MLARGLLNRGEHRLAGQTRGIFPLLLRHAVSGRGYRLLDVLIPLLDDLLDPRLRLHDALHQPLVAVEHKQQVSCQFE